MERSEFLFVCDVFVKLWCRSGCGHYTAHCEMDDQWFHFNDRTVKSCTVEELLKQQAYLLFYRKIAEPTVSSSAIPPMKIIDL
mgnify:CR=1 FL=1